MQAPLRMLAITLPLGLSKDDNAPSVVTVSNTRYLQIMKHAFDDMRELLLVFVVGQFSTRVGGLHNL